MKTRALLAGLVLVVCILGAVVASRPADPCGELAEDLCAPAGIDCTGLDAKLRAQVPEPRCREAGDSLRAVGPEARSKMAVMILELLLGAPKLDPVVRDSADAGVRTLIQLKRPTELLQSGSRLYWASRWMGAIGVISTNGKNERVLLEGVNRPTHLALDATNLYWLSDSADPGIFIAPREGGEPRALTPKDVRPEAFAVDAAGVIFTRGDGTLWRVTREGTGLTHVASGLPKHVSRLLPQEGTVFAVAEASALGRVQLLQLDADGAWRVVVDDQPGLWSLTQRGPELYWSTGSAIMRLGAKGAETVLSVVGFALQFTDSHVYFLQPGEPGQGKIMRKRLDDASAPELVAANLNRPISFAVEGDRVFVLDEGEEGVGAILAP